MPIAVVKGAKMSSLYAILKKELEFVRTRIKRFYNKNRLDGPCLEEGGKVYLISQNLCTKRPSRKLDFRKTGPFRISKKISENNYTLTLPLTIGLQTNVFYISLLELASKNVLIAKDAEAEDEEEEWEVEEVVTNLSRILSC